MSTLFTSTIFFSKEYSITHYKRLPGPVTEGGNRWPPVNGHRYDYGCAYITRSTILAIRIRLSEKIVYTAKLFGFKSFRIQSFHFKFRIQNAQRLDQIRELLFRIRPVVCKRQNQSGTKTFRILHESGTISSSVNLVWLQQPFVEKSIWLTFPYFLIC